jgi:hypothetical protein
MRNGPLIASAAMLTLALGSAAGELGTATPASAAPAITASSPLACQASVSNRDPADYTTVHVYVRTVDRASIRIVAHYRTTNHVKYGHAGRHGNDTINYYISGATPGFKVNLTLTVRRNGRKGTCATSFTPHS